MITSIKRLTRPLKIIGIKRSSGVLCSYYNGFSSVPPLVSPPPPSINNKDLYKDQNNTWVDRHVPPILKPYFKLARVDRPIGTWLLLYPTLWGSAIAAPAGSLFDVKLALLFSTGAFLMRGAGCTINDMWDKDFDGKVARTASRPLAAGDVTTFNALVFLGGQLTASLGVLLSLNPSAILVGAASLPLVVAYPLAKRFTNWPQVILGLAMNYGVLVGYTAVTGHIDYHVVAPLYMSGIAWTLVYDTIYAHQDKEDDSKLGLKSTALHFGDSTPLILHGFTSLSMTALTAAGYMADLSWPFYIGVGAASSHLLWQVQTMDMGNRINLTERFVSNFWVGHIVWTGIVLGKLV